MPQDDPFLGMAHYFHSGSLGNNLMVPAPGPAIQEQQEYADAELAKLAATIDPAERKAISDDLQIYLMENYWRLPVYWEQEAVAFWPEVRGYAHAGQPSGTHVKFEQVWIDPAHQNDTGNRGQTTGVPGGF